ncbi:MAG TPA: polyprenyl synthetase family protein [Clostridiales bacterium]|nr:polyprenyl synthetase family protein [Clostridiales bacterium]
MYIMNMISKIEEALIEYLPSKDCIEKKLIESMEYSLMAGGKRIRPCLVLEFSHLCGGDLNQAMPFACGVEMIHTYSLIHDDLPCMDDDDYRRGRKANHIVYGEDTALLAGDALQALAFEIMSSSATEENAYRATKAVAVLAKYCGAVGMVGGQVIDLTYEDKTANIDVLREMDSKKTSGLIKAACEMGCIIGGATHRQVQAARDFGESIGIAFQIMDDILDVVADEKKLGKPTGSDAGNNKSTYVSLLGLEKCKLLIDELTDKAIKSLENFSGDITGLKDLALKLASRDY